MQISPRVYFPLSVRFLLFIILMIAVQGSVLFQISFSQIKSGLITEKEHELKLTMSAYNQFLNQAYRKGKTNLIEGLLDPIKQNQHISDAYIISDNNTIISDLANRHVGHDILGIVSPAQRSPLSKKLLSLTQTKQQQIWYDKQSNTLHALGNYYLGDNRYLYLKMDLNHAEQEALIILLQQFTPSMTILFLGGLLLAFYFRRLVSQRVQALQKSADQFTTHNQLILPNQTKNDELYRLGNAFSDLMNKVLYQHNEIAEKEENLKAILNSIGDGVIATDHRGHVQSCNPKAEELTGLTLQDMVDQPIGHVLDLHNINTHSALDQLSRYAQNPQLAPLNNEELLLVSKQNKELRVLLSIYGINNNKQALNGAVFTVKDITAQHAFEREAHKERSLMTAMMNNIPSIVFSCDTSGRIIFTNKKFEHQFNLSLSSIKGKTFGDIFPIVIAKKLIAEDSEVIRTKQPKIIETQLLHQHETLRFLMVKFPIYDEQGYCSAICTIANDINEIWHLQEQLSQIIKDTPLGAISWNEHFCVTDWNPAAENIFGYTREEALGQHIDFLFNNEINDLISTKWKDIQSMTKSTQKLSENTTASGARILCDWIITPQVDASGQTCGAISFISDVTSQQKALRSLVNKEREQSEVLNSLSSAIFKVNQDGKIRSNNRSATRLLNYSASEFSKITLDTIVPLPDSENGNYINQWRDNKDFFPDRELIAHTKDGEQIPVYVTVTELPKDIDNNPYFIVSLQDLRDQKAQEEILRRSKKMESLGLLTGGIAHDFNNILGIIQGYADMLKYALKDQPKLDRYASEIRQASERGAHLASKLLASSKKKRIDESVVNINDAILQQETMLKKAISQDIKLELSLQEDLWTAYLDGSDLDDVILNMVVNADHAMPNGGKISITTYNKQVDSSNSGSLQLKQGDYVVLSINDTGQGMPDEVKEQIFDPFFSTKGDDGTGLGLSQAYGFVQRSNGDIKVQSALGEGTQFCIFFPRHKDNNKQSKKTESFMPDLNLEEQNRERILVVDDEAPLRELCTEILSDSGYEVFSAKDGKEALNFLRENAVDLLFSDVVMPELNGYELAQESRKLYPDLKILLTSGFDANHFEKYGDEELRKNIISKPYSPFALLNKIKRTLEQK